MASLLATLMTILSVIIPGTTWRGETLFQTDLLKLRPTASIWLKAQILIEHQDDGFYRTISGTE